MNKYVKALNFIKGTLSAFHQRTNSEVPKKENEWLNTLQELTDKATPKKPTKIEIVEAIDCLFIYGECPTCKCGVNDSEIYCPYCGQALDWSEE